MSHPDDDKRSAAPAAAGKPSLEALLRLKRAERPDDAFWQEFERGLHRKQLAAIVEPRPWWLGLAIWGRRLAPVGLPASAAAAALLAVMVVRTQSPFSPAAYPSSSPRAVVAAARGEDKAAPVANVAASAPSLVIASAVPGSHSHQAPRGGMSATPAEIVGDPGETSLDATISTSVDVASADASSASDAIIVPLVDSLLELGGATSFPTPSETTIADNLAAAQAESPGMIAAVAPVSSGDGEAHAADGPDAEPVLKMEVRNPRHARVLIAMADNPSVETTGGLSSLRDRFVRGLDREDSLSGSARRLGVGGDRLSVSF